MYIDGASSREGSGSGVVLISPTQQKVTISYKLQFSTTNNTAEYEALLLGMKATKYLGDEQLIAFGDSKLVIKQVRNNYQVKNSKFKNYRNEVWDLIEHYFSTFNINFVTREENQIADSLAMAASNFKVPLDVKVIYDVQIKKIGRAHV